MKTLFILLLGTLSYSTYAQVKTYPAGAAKVSPQLYKENRTVPVLSHSNKDAGDLILSDDFSDPENWNAIALIGEPNWEVVMEEPEEILTFMGSMASTTEANGFGMFNGIQYLVGDSVVVQDCVLEYAPTIDLSDYDHVTLSFEQMYRAYYHEQTFLEISNDGGVSYDFSYEINTGVVTNESTIQETIALNISEAAAGYESIKVRFRWKGLETGAFGSGYGWLVDDFKIFESFDYDQEITAAYHRSGLGGYLPNGLEYYQISETERTTIYFSGKVINLGAKEQENIKLNVEVSGSETFATTSALFDLPINGLDSVGCLESFNPTADGVYFVKYWFDSDSAEQITGNDTIYDQFEINSGSEQLHSRDNNIGASSISNVEYNEGLPFLIGNVMEILSEGKFCNAEVVVSDQPTNIGRLIFAQLMVYLEEIDSFVYVDQTNDQEITSWNNGGPITLNFTDEHEFSVGTTILILVGHYGGENPVEFRLAANKVEETTVLGYRAGSLTPFYLEDPNALMLRLIMPAYHCFDQINESENNTFLVAQNHPNPFNTSTTIEYELTSTQDVLITITDLTGKVIQEINLLNQSAGTNQLTLDASNYANGTYFYTLTAAGISETKKMVVVK